LILYCLPDCIRHQLFHHLFVWSSNLFSGLTLWCREWKNTLLLPNWYHCMYVFFFIMAIIIKNIVLAGIYLPKWDVAYISTLWEIIHFFCLYITYKLLSAIDCCNSLGQRSWKNVSLRYIIVKFLNELKMIVCSFFEDCAVLDNWLIIFCILWTFHVSELLA